MAAPESFLLEQDVTWLSTLATDRHRMAFTLAGLADAAHTWQDTARDSVARAFKKLRALVDRAADQRQQVLKDAYWVMTSSIDAADEELKAVRLAQSNNTVDAFMMGYLQGKMQAVKDAVATVDSVTKLPVFQSLPPPSSSIEAWLNAACAGVSAGFFVPANQ